MIKAHVEHGKLARRKKEIVELIDEGMGIDQLIDYAHKSWHLSLEEAEAFIESIMSELSGINGLRMIQDICESLEYLYILTIHSKDLKLSNKIIVGLRKYSESITEKTMDEILHKKNKELKWNLII